MTMKSPPTSHSLHPSPRISPTRMPIRRVKCQNVVSRLKMRETGISWSPRHSPFGSPCSTTGSPYGNLRSRPLLQNVVPNFTVVNIDKPPCFLRKFSPDGRVLTAFSADQTSVEVYEYQGPAAGESLLKDWPGGSHDGLSKGRENTENPYGREIGKDIALEGIDDSLLLDIRSRIFTTYFKLIHTIQVTSNGEHLNRECSLFTDDSNFLVVGSALFVSDEYNLHYFDIYRSNESVGVSSRVPLEDYTLHLIDIKNGRLCDSRQFKTDKIYLSHNQGIYLYKDTLAVLSVQHQVIHLFKLDLDPILGEGQFVHTRTIGRFCFPDDEFVSSIPSHLSSSPNSSLNRPSSSTSSSSPQDSRHRHRINNPSPIRPYRETTINCLKHRFLVHLFKDSLKPEIGSRFFSPRHFYQNFDHLLALRMWKMQLLDEDHLLIKYANEDVITLRSNDLNSSPCFFAVYRISTTEVIAVYDNTSAELLSLLENFCDQFRNIISCSPSNNPWSRVSQQRYKQTIINARNGGTTEATKRLLSQLPIAAQSYTTTPYLDLGLFSYDEKWVSVMERPKTCADLPIRFYARDSGFLRFKISAGQANRPQMGGNQAPRRLVAYIFHPYDPFAISVQRTNSEYVVNFHVRHVKC